MKASALLWAVAALLLQPTFASAACLREPAPSGVVTSLYGWRFHPVLKLWRLHRGVDLRADMMSSLVATHNGVAQVTFSASGGNELRIVGADGTVARYLHLTRATIDPGASVSAGQEVALSGNTGHASAAPHLHLEVYPAGGKGDVNPEPLLCPSPSRKAGAEQVNGFPIMACRPDDGAACSPGPGLTGTNAGAADSPGPGPSSGGVVVGAVASGASSSPSPAPSPQQFDDMSTREIFVSEVMKRFGNPDWYARLQERTTVPLLAEYLHMLALEGAMALENHSARTRVEGLLAARLARDNTTDMTIRLARQREATLKAGR